MARIEIPGLSNISNTASKLAGNFIELTSLATDYQKSYQNSGIMATVKLPYYTETNGKDEGVVSATPATVTGFMLNGFGWSLQNEYEALLENTSAQKMLNSKLMGGAEFASRFSQDIIKPDNILLSGANTIMMSLQQTMSMWVGTKKPSFDLELLFFDSDGEDSSDVTKVAYIIERAMTPYVNKAEFAGVNGFMQAPGGYRPLLRNTNNKGQLNRTYNMSADNTAEVRIGNYLYFPELICTGVHMKYSDKILNTGKPQWLTVQFNFSMWRQQVLEDLNVRYM